MIVRVGRAWVGGLVCPLHRDFPGSGHTRDRDTRHPDRIGTHGSDRDTRGSDRPSVRSGSGHTASDRIGTHGSDRDTRALGIGTHGIGSGHTRIGPAIRPDRIGTHADRTGHRADRIARIGSGHTASGRDRRESSPTAGQSRPTVCPANLAQKTRSSSGFSAGPADAFSPPWRHRVTSSWMRKTPAATTWPRDARDGHGCWGAIL